jgi:hypothetical protein
VLPALKILQRFNGLLKREDLVNVRPQLVHLRKPQQLFELLLRSAKDSTENTCSSYFEDICATAYAPHHAVRHKREHGRVDRFGRAAAEEADVADHTPACNGVKALVDLCNADVVEDMMNTCPLCDLSMR